MTNEQGKLPPQNIKAEEALLGSILVDAKRMYDIIDFLKPDAFYNEINGIIYNAMLTLQAKTQPIDIITVGNKLKEQGKMETVGGSMALISLTNRVGSTANVAAYAKIIHDNFIKRKAIQLSYDLGAMAYDEKTTVDEIINLSQKAANQIANNIVVNNTKTAADLFKETLKTNDILIRKTDSLIGTDTGLNALNKITCGFQKSDLIIVAARPGQGKTSLALKILDAPIQNGVATGIFSLEMSSRQLYARLVSQKTGIPLNSILRQGMNQFELEKVLSNQGVLCHENMLFDDTGGLSLFNLVNKARTWKREKNIGLLVVDYLQLVTNKDRNTTREQEVSEVSRTLKSLAKELDIPVVALAQLSRSSEKRGVGSRPIPSDLRESGSIEQDADMIIFIHRPIEYGVTEFDDGSPTLGRAELIIAKHRNGGTGLVRVGYEGALTNFYDINDDPF